MKTIEILLFYCENPPQLFLNLKLKLVDESYIHVERIFPFRCYIRENIPIFLIKNIMCLAIFIYKFQKWLI